MKLIRLLLFLILLNTGYSLLMPFSNYKITENYVLSNGIKIENADLETFQIIDEALAKDKNNIYLGSKIIENADVESFIPIKGINGSLYYKDKNNVYFLEIDRLIKIDGAHPKSFIVYDYITAEDKESKYFRETKITDKNTIKDWGKRVELIKEGVYFPL